MTILDDLLALLPDNTSGAIDAADLREIVSTIWEHGSIVEARVSALESNNTGTGSVSITGVWNLSSSAGAVPSAKSMTCDTGDFTTASWLRFAVPDKNGVDLTAAITGATRIFGQQKKDSRTWVNLNVTGLATSAGSYVEVPVNVVEFETGGVSPWGEAIVVFVV